MSAELLSFGHVAGATQRRRSTIWLGVAAVAACAVFACGFPPFCFGQKIEARWFPVLADQSIPPAAVTRIDRTLCWDWLRTKTRAPRLLALNVVLETSDGDTFAPEIFDADHGLPWHGDGAAPIGRSETRLCTTVPASVSQDVPVRLRQSMSFDGFLALWTLDTPLPSVVAD